MSASKTAFYTFGAMRGASVYSVTSAATGYPKEHLIDFDPDTFWKPASTDDQTIIIDLGSAQSFDGLLLWIHNNLTDHKNGNNAIIKISHATSAGGAYTQWGTNEIFVNDYLTPSPVYIWPQSPTPISKQFWKIELTVMGTTIELSHIGLFRKYTVDQAPQWPDRDYPIFPTRIAQVPSGRFLVSPISSRSHKIISRAYLFPTSTEWTDLLNAYNDCRGSQIPFVYVDSDADSTARMARFVDAGLLPNEVDYQLYNPTVNFVEVPYKPDGATY